VSSVRYELGFDIPEFIFHSHGRGNLKSYISARGLQTYEYM
jgi:hypothetical protein